MPSPSANLKSVSVGDILADKYRVERVLGAGGMGVVVAAMHLELDEKVAIKFLLDDADLESEHAERFLREARAAVKIKSEHVARVIDVGRLPSRAPYMVMEYLEGADLNDYVARKKLQVEDAVDYVIQACEAMSVAHRAGIVHRDLKPANLFRAKRPDGSVVIKVLDFGISKVLLPDASQAALTQTSTMMGSPLYMSPEQMRSTKNADARSDIWSLGAILYELLTGTPPFNSETLGDLFAKIMLEGHQPAHERRAEVPVRLSQVVDRCLEKDPAHRYQSTEQLAVALGEFAPERSQVLVRRLGNTLRGAGNGPTDPPPRRETPALDATEVDLGNVALGGEALAAEARQASVQLAEQPDPVSGGHAGATRTSWEHTGRRGPDKTRPRYGLGLLLGAAALVVAGYAFVSHTASEPPDEARSQASTPVRAEPVESALPPVHEPPRADTTTPEPAPEKPEVDVEKFEAVAAAKPASSPAPGRAGTPKRAAARKPKPKPKPAPTADSTEKAVQLQPAKNPLSIEFK